MFNVQAARHVASFTGRQYIQFLISLPINYRTILQERPAGTKSVQGLPISKVETCLIGDVSTSLGEGSATCEEITFQSNFLTAGHRKVETIQAELNKLGAKTRLLSSFDGQHQVVNVLASGEECGREIWARSRERTKNRDDSEKFSREEPLAL